MSSSSRLALLGLASFHVSGLSGAPAFKVPPAEFSFRQSGAAAYPAIEELHFPS